MISFLRRHQKSIFYGVLAVFLSGIFVGLGGYWFTSRDLDGAVARVGKTKISGEMLAARVNQYADAVRSRGEDIPEEALPRLRREILNDMIVEELLALKAEELGLVVTDQELARDIRASPAFRRGGAFDQDAYFAQVRARFRQSPQEYERRRRRAIAVARLKQLVFRMAKVSPEEARAAYAAQKKGPAKDAEKERAAFVQSLQQQRAIDLINHWLRQIAAQVDHQVFYDRVDGGA